MYNAKPPYIRGVFINHLKRARLRFPGKTMRQYYRYSIFFQFGKIGFGYLKEKDRNLWLMQSDLSNRQIPYCSISGATTFMKMFDSNFPVMQFELEFERLKNKALLELIEKGEKPLCEISIPDKPDNYDPIVDNIYDWQKRL